MSRRHAIGYEAAVEEQREEHDPAIVDEVEERAAALAPSVEQTMQARFESEDLREEAGRQFGQTLAEEERQAAIEWEIERTRRRWDRRQDSAREARCRAEIEAQNAARRTAFAERAGSVDRWQHPDEADPRAQLTRKELGRVNREAARLSERLGGWSPASVSRLLAERVADGSEVSAAVLHTMAVLQTDPGHIVPIGRIGEVGSREVRVEGVVTTLWPPSHPRIAQVGLLEDASGRTKLTSWKRSMQPRFEVGDRIRIRDAAKSWYGGRWSIALTSRSRIEILGSG